jgi:hypothetical protein
MIHDLRNVGSGTGWRRGARYGAILAVTVGSVMGFALASSTAASATPPHGGCAAVSAGASSGWCPLYPGNATSNTQELGMVTVSADGSSIQVETQNASNGAAPQTSFVCLVSSPASQIAHRLPATLCAAAGGVWIPFTGGSLTIDLWQYPQFLNAQFTMQVAANHNAGDANGDSFYNNVGVSTLGQWWVP